MISMDISGWGYDEIRPSLCQNPLPPFTFQQWPRREASNVRLGSLQTWGLNIPFIKSHDMLNKTSKCSQLTTNMEKNSQHPNLPSFPNIQSIGSKNVKQKLPAIEGSEVLQVSSVQNPYICRSIEILIGLFFGSLLLAYEIIPI